MIQIHQSILIFIAERLRRIRRAITNFVHLSAPKFKHLHQGHESLYSEDHLCLNSHRHKSKFNKKNLKLLNLQTTIQEINVFKNCTKTLPPMDHCFSPHRQKLGFSKIKTLKSCKQANTLFDCIVTKGGRHLS